VMCHTDIKEHEKDVKELENQQTSSLVWIAVAGHNCSEVNVVDANSPGDVLDTFYVCSSRVLCIASVPGEWRDTILYMTLFTNRMNNSFNGSSSRSSRVIRPKISQKYTSPTVITFIITFGCLPH